MHRLRIANGTIRNVSLWVGALVAAKLSLLVLDSSGIYEFSTPLPTTLLGVIIGLTYGLLSVGLVLIYRTNRIINFAHGQIGAFGAAFFGLLAVKWNVPYWVAFPIALALAAGTGAAAETGVVRRLRRAPRIMSVVATLGVGQFLVVFALVINSRAASGSAYPQPQLPGWASFEVGALLVTPAYAGMLFLSPVAVIAIAVFLRRSRFGLAMRSAADNPDAARMAGISASRMSSLAWAIAGALSAFAAILTAPTQGFTGGDTFGPALLLRAMAGAVLARMNNLPLALAAGVGLGVVEQLLLWNDPRSGTVEVYLFVIILVALLVQRQSGGRDEEKGSWVAVQALRPVPETLRQIWLVRNLGLLVGAFFVVVVALLPRVITNADAVTVTGILGFSVVGLAVGILTGLGGQLTLGQFAVGAIGAVASAYVSNRTGNFPIAVFYGGLAAAFTSVVVGLPALRIRGLMLTVTTLSFALVTPAWLLGQLVGDGVDPGRPIVFGQPLDTGRRYFYFALCLFVVALVLARNVRRSGFGRLLVSVRDNEDNARAFTVRASLVKVQAFLLAGFIAGIGGALYGHSLSNLGASAFPPAASINVVVMTVIGGLAVLGGPIAGAMFVLGVPAFLPLDSAGLAATQLGQLILILYLPGGLAHLAEPIRDRLVRAIARARGIDVAAAYAADQAEGSNAHSQDRPALTIAPSNGTRAPQRSSVLLDARDLRRSFGGVHAVRGVSLEIRAGETVGLIGPNGAGKTTVFELLGGFTRPDSGRVVFNQQDVTRAAPERRASLGLVRSFQDAGLFPTMTVTECVMLALERAAPTSFVVSLTGWASAEREKARRARELIAFMRLDRYRDKQVQELSTGTRRIAEIACLVALSPTLLLLDEPSSGIAQRETEALGALLMDLKRDFDLTLLVIEHDIPLIMGISDRIVAMNDGVVIAQGTPEHVRSDPIVVEAYLGGRVEALDEPGASPALARSGAWPA